MPPFDSLGDPSCCCGPGHGQPGKCTFTVVAMDAGTGLPLAGVSVAIQGDGKPIGSGTTDGSGLFVVTVARPPASATLTATRGGCTWSQAISCGRTTIYQCVATVRYKSLDDSGGDGPPVKFFAEPGAYGSVASMTGGGPDASIGGGAWSSTSPGTAAFCWFGPVPARGAPFGYSVGTISHAYPLDPVAGVGNSGDDTYWESCTTSAPVPCGDSTFYPAYYRKSQWNAMPCCKYGCVDETNALPKRACATIDAPAEVVGQDSGRPITLDWDPTSWDGSDKTAWSEGPFGGNIFATMLYTTGCLGGNGAGGYCYGTSFIPGFGPCGDLIQHNFVAYASHRVDLSITPTTVNAAGFVGTCSGTVRYANYWNGGCPNPDPKPDACSPADQYWGLIPPVYCTRPASPPCTGVFSGGQYPQSLGFAIAGPHDFQGDFTGCEPVDWDDAASEGAGWRSTCTIPYDPTYGQVATCTVDACGEPPPEDPDGPATRARKAAAPPSRARSRLASPRSGGPGTGPVRVGIASVGCYLGGAERWISDLLDHCDGSRIAWEGVAYLDAASAAPSIPTVRADWEAHCPVSSGPGAIRDLARRVDVLVAWGIMTWQLEGLLAPDYPLVQVSHSSRDEPEIHRMADFPGSALAAVSRAALRGIPPGRRAAARVIRNCVAPSRLARTLSDAGALARWGLPEGAKVAAWLGRIADEKRPGVFIDGIARLPAGWWGVMVGAGLDRDEAIAYAARVAPGRVLFPDPVLGPVGDVLGPARCHVMPTMSEGNSLAAAESWLMPVPLISTRVGQLLEDPQLARLLPDEPTGADVAAAILADAADPRGTGRRVALARRFAGTALAPARFGREWTDFLCSRARPRADPGAAPTRPTLVGKAIGFGKAAVAHVAAGRPIAPPEVQAERERICFACAHLDKVTDTCNICGCGLMKLKRSWADQGCPLSQPKWGPVAP